MVAIFPEGISHDRARPAAAAHRGRPHRPRRGRGRGASGVETVAVALVYDDKQRFRSRALVRVGVPEPVDRWLDDVPGTTTTGRCAGLTDDLARPAARRRARLRLVVGGRRSWPAIAEIVARADERPPRRGGPGRPGGDCADAGGRGVGQLDHAGPGARSAGHWPRPTVTISTAVGLTDAQVAASYRSGRLRWALAGGAGQGGRSPSPWPWLGMVIHLVPYQLVKRARPGSRATRGCGPPSRCWAASSLFTPCLRGPRRVGRRDLRARVRGLAAVGAPLCGYLAVRMTERLRRMGGAVGGLPVGPGQGTGGGLGPAPSGGGGRRRRSGPGPVRSGTPGAGPTAIDGRSLTTARTACHHGRHHVLTHHLGTPPYLTANATSRSPATS